MSTLHALSDPPSWLDDDPDFEALLPHPATRCVAPERTDAPPWKAHQARAAYAPPDDTPAPSEDRFGDDDPDLKPHPRAAAGQDEEAQGAEWIDGSAAFDPQDPVPFVVRDLYICPGRHTQIQGFGYSGKTIAAMSLALSVATGKPAWGHFHVRSPGLVGHIDHEQGKRATLRRYHRLARAMGIARGDLAGKLKVLCLPSFRLSDDDAEAWLILETAGMVLCVIDSLRATVLGCDENDSSIRAFLDKLLRVSEATGCSFVLIHHAGKSQQGRDARETGRGSSAIFDSAGTVLRLAVEESEEAGATITKVTMTKSTADADGSALEPFYLRIEDVASDDATDLKWGLRCAYQSEQQIHPPTSGADRQRRLEQELLCEIEREPGRSTNALLQAVTGDDKAKKVALETLERQGKVRSEKGARKADLWFSVRSPAGGSDEY